ncbi:MAG: aminotransferase class III-fold pyridoxal phosphate-dependent enzyme [Candidatus Omnitrophota bacterium]|jgi:putrescine aminotransferase
MSDTINVTMDNKERDDIQKLFGKHISWGQVRYLRCANMDVYERTRKGSTFTDAVSGERFFDCFSSAGCFNVGRGNTEIMDTLRDALNDHDMGSHGILSQAKVSFAIKLASLCPGDLNKVVLCASGADACAGAIKLAKGATGRNDVITMKKAYHGHEGFSLSANGKDYYKELFLPLMPGFHIVDFNDLEEVKRLAGKNIAAIVLEPVQGEGGIHVATMEYMKGLRKICDENGIMLIFDEVQTGFGRTGTLWAMEQYGVMPDIMFTAKAIGGGVYPNGAVVYREIKSLTEYVEANPLFHTSHGGGTDLGCIVSSAVLDYLVENKVWENAAKVGKRFKDGLNEIRRDNSDLVKEVRGMGLMIGIEYQYEFVGALMADCLARKGVWAVFSANAPQVMRFQIPITASMAEVEELLRRIKAAVRIMRVYLIFLKPLAVIPFIRRILDNVHVQIIAFNLIRDVEEFVGRLFPKKQEVKS